MVAIDRSLLVGHMGRSVALLGKWSALSTVYLMRTSPLRLQITSSGLGRGAGLGLGFCPPSCFAASSAMCDAMAQAGVGLDRPRSQDSQYRYWVCSGTRIKSIPVSCFASVFVGTQN